MAAILVRLMMCAAVLAIPFALPAQDDTPVHACGCTLDAGGGWVPRAGIENEGLHGGWNFQGGFGLQMPPLRRHRWTWFVDANFTYAQAAVTQSALQNAAILNPTNIGLQEAKNGASKFYAVTLDPTFRFPIRHTRAQWYFFGGVGWFKRSLEFTGASGEGVLLEPGNPMVFGTGGNSAAYDGGVGFNVRLAEGLMFYAEARALHGLAINKTTTLLPVSAGLRW